MESFEVQGEWWLPNQTERFPGVLRFTPADGATLEVIGDLRDPALTKRRKQTSFLGVDLKGYRYTVFSPRLRMLWVHPRRRHRYSYTSLFVLKGAHCPSVDDVRIQKVSCRFSQLDQWIDISGIQIADRSGDTLIRVYNPESLTVDIDSTLRLLIDISFDSNLHIRRVWVEQNAWLGLDALQRPFALSEALGLVQHLRHFIALGMGEPTYILECKVLLKDRRRRKPVDATLMWPQGVEAQPRSLVSPRSTLFTWKDLGYSGDVYIRNWFAQRQKLQGFFDLYFGALYNPWLNAENVFLAYVRALELYHRTMGFDQYEVKPEDHERRIREILDAVPQIHRKWLCKRLEYSNQKSLRHRLQEIWNTHGDILTKYFGKQKEFIQRVLDTRNYLIHQDPARKNRALSGQDLVRMNRSLALILRLLCVLDLLGMSETEVEALVKRRQWLLCQGRLNEETESQGNLVPQGFWGDLENR